MYTQRQRQFSYFSRSKHFEVSSATVPQTLLYADLTVLHGGARPGLHAFQFEQEQDTTVLQHGSEHEHDAGDHPGLDSCESVRLQQPEQFCKIGTRPGDHWN